jgi:hypothetical protein
MGQEANSRRNASLDDKKRRAAGRRNQNPEVVAIQDFAGTLRDDRRAAGAFGAPSLTEFLPPPDDVGMSPSPSA